MYHFCTYFDHGYLPRGLALYESLRRHCPSFRLWVLCMDEAAYSALAALSLPGVELIALADLERGDDDLLRAKGTRSRVEYYFTCTPSLPLYILARWPEVTLITYLDADLFFFGDPQPIFAAIADRSIAVVPHRFSRKLRRLEKLGRYNVGWVSFRRDESGLACLRWWRDRCNEWCYDRYEPGRFADQKYLDAWPKLFNGLVELNHKGVNLAPWNVANYSLSVQGDRIWVDDDPLIFFHFHAFRQPMSWLYDHRLYLYKTRPSAIVLRRIYVPYIHALAAVHHDRPLAQPQRKLGLLATSLARAGDLLDIGYGLLAQRYIIVHRGRLIYLDRPFRPIDLGAQAYA